MSRPAPLAAALLLVACDERPAAPPALPAGLHVPMPAGWRASPVALGLAVGPPGRPVLQLEQTTRPFPDPALFVAALEQEGVKILKKESLNTFVGVLYSIDEKRAFVGVQQAGPVTVWCASVPGAKPDEVETGLGLCRSIVLPDAG